ncbi:MAG: penicillin-binding transpeptidase domain-containing protein, partial [Polyangiaceae bacterium]|nr:penicillin-binding transpeptidase domain-containing protein [Polyangiaceae bacterium]
ARGGVRPSLRVIDHLLTAGGRTLAPPRPRNPKARAIRGSTAEQLSRMLRVTVREGTAAHAFQDRDGQRYLGTYEGVGKTGTLARGKPTRLFSWYAGFAPANRPQVAVAVMLANEDRWWRKGNAVARDVLRAYFARKRVAGISHPLRSRSARRTDYAGTR